MRWIKRKLRNWLNSEAYCDTGVGSNSVRSITESSVVDNDPVLNFRIFSAQNGLILEFRSYNQKTDRSAVSTYIIPENESISDYVQQCLPMEMLKVEQ